MIKDNLLFIIIIPLIINWRVCEREVCQNNKRITGIENFENIGISVKKIEKYLKMSQNNDKKSKTLKY